jgi:hypothetical protein
MKTPAATTSRRAFLFARESQRERVPAISPNRNDQERLDTMAAAKKGGAKKKATRKKGVVRKAAAGAKKIVGGAKKAAKKTAGTVKKATRGARKVGAVLKKAGDVLEAGAAVVETVTAKAGKATKRPRRKAKPAPK